MTVSRLVHFLRLHLVGKTISNTVAPDDPILFGKAGTTAAAFTAAALGKKVCVCVCVCVLEISNVVETEPLLTTLGLSGHLGWISGQILLVRARN